MSEKIMKSKPPTPPNTPSPAPLASEQDQPRNPLDDGTRPTLDVPGLGRCVLFGDPGHLRSIGIDPASVNPPEKPAVPEAEASSAKCEHTRFFVQANVARCLDDETQQLSHLVAEITIICEDCQEPMSFPGFPAGSSFDHATVSVDGTELRVPMAVGRQQIAASSSYQMPPKRKLQ